MRVRLLCMDQATLTLVLASAGLSISLISLAWQFTQHFLAGPRLSVSLKPAFVTHVGALITRDTGTSRSSDHVPHRAMLDQGLWENVGVIQVQNNGRLGISISHVSLTFEDLHIWRRRPRRWAKRTDFVVPGLDMFDSVIDGGPQHLAIGEMRQWIVPLSSVEEWIEKEAIDRPLRLRAVAHAGTRSSMSKPNRLWHFKPQWIGRFQYAPVDDGTRLFRRLLAAVEERNPSAAYMAYRSLTSMESSDPMDVARELEAYVGGGPIQSFPVAYAASELLPNIRNDLETRRRAFRNGPDTEADT